MPSTRFLALLDEARAIHEAKNHDYAGDGDPWANFRECEKIGIPAFAGCLVRMGDKWRRIENLARRGGEAAVKSESVTDTLIDLANYALIAVCLWEEARGESASEG